MSRFARGQIVKKLQKLEHGCLVIDEDGVQSTYGNDELEPVVIRILDPRFWVELAFGGSNGGGEAYIQGYWTCNDLVALIRLLLRNSDILTSLEGSVLPWAKIMDRLRHYSKRNTQSGSAANIAAHYDLGNDFFRLFLDEKLMYSSAYYPQTNSSLDEAATAKLERICEKLNLSESDHVLEIGTGWGGFAVYAAKNYGCRVTTTTISKQQYEFACEKVRQAGLQDRVTLLLEDYRELNGEFDKVVSIEMIEAVGHQYLKTYIEQCSKLLVDDGVLFLQAITIRDQAYAKAIKNVDYIKKYVFPGGFLPSITAVSAAMAKVSDLKIVHLEDLGDHYARTLADWHERFIENLDHIRNQSFPETFIRLWQFYLCYCEGSFRESYIGLVQLVANKPRAITRGVRLSSDSFNLHS